MNSLRLPLAWRILWREWRGGEIALLFMALLLGVTMVTGISLFAERLQKALVGEASAYLGGDRVLQVSEPLTPAQLQQLGQYPALRVARTAQFPTMVYPTDHNSDRLVLAALKSVSAAYPLRGELEIRDGSGARQTVRQGPAPGEAWVDNNILLQLDLQHGDTIEIGTAHFTVSHTLLREGDAGNSFYGMGSRVMISDSDLPATGLVLPGSRIEYRYLFAGEAETLDAYFNWLKPQLPTSARWMTLGDNQPGIAGALDKAGLFLQLAGSLGVLLAAMAAGFAAQRFSERHVNTVAVMKTLGANRPQVLRLLSGQMAGLWLLSTAGGFLLGAFLQQLFLLLLAEWVPADLPSPGPMPFLLGAATSAISLLCFVGPAFWRLVATPPWRVLRSEHRDALVYHRGLWLALPGIAALLWLYSQHVVLVVLLMAGLLALIVPVSLAAWLLLRSGRALGSRAGSYWRLGLANLMRRRWLSLLQVVVFSIGFMLLAVMVLLRSSLLDEWRMQVPADAPNVFLLNIAPDDVPRLEQDLAQIGLRTAGLYPMVRGRLTRINDQPATELFSERVNEVYRELNLSWSAALPADNEIVEGTWPGQRAETDGAVPVSVEQRLAERLQLKLGDRLVFTIGDATRLAYVASFRSLDWDKMTPNFYFLFPPATLDGLNATWMTSLHRNETEEAALSRILRTYPSVSAYPVDDLIARIQSIVQRASLAVEVILALVLLAGLLVLFTCLRASLDQRMHESALLRTLGAGRRLVLGSLAVEFFCIGLVAGLLAAVAAEITGYFLQTRLFDMPFSWHPSLWLATPAIAMTLVGAVGTVLCLPVVKTPPILTLRASDSQA